MGRLSGCENQTVMLNVRISTGAKEMLERLLADYSSSLGTRVSQTQVVEMMIYETARSRGLHE